MPTAKIVVIVSTLKSRYEIKKQPSIWMFFQLQFCMDFAGNKILDFNADLTTSRHCAQIKTLFIAYLLPLQLASSMSSLGG